MTKRNVRSRAGFTLPEILVSVAMVGVLSAAVLPTVVGQIGKSEITRIVQELQTVAGATQVFRADVGRWPGLIQHLVVPVDATDASSDQDNYLIAEADRWKGPYLTETAANASGLPTASGATIADDLERVDLGTNNNFLRIQVTGIDAATAEAVNLEIDGGLEGSWWLEGQIRFASPGTTLSFYPYPFK